MVRDIIAGQVRSIEPYDDVEDDHQSATLAWIESGADLFRIKKPDVPKQHLVSYFAVVDPVSQKMLLQNHLLAKKWLPSGGHVEEGEDPVDTVRRECAEELGLEAKFLGEPKPHFVTVTPVIDGDKVHTDVSLWFLLQADEKTPLEIEENKFSEVRWWNIADVLGSPLEQFDPEMHRFCKKILAEHL